MEEYTKALRDYLTSITPSIWHSRISQIEVSGTPFNIEVSVEDSFLQDSTAIKNLGIRSSSGDLINNLGTFADYFDHGVEWLAEEIVTKEVAKNLVRNGMVKKIVHNGS